MTDIVVVRGGGTSQGDDIVDSLLTSDASAMARGRIALDEGSGLHPMSVECVYREGLVLGSLVSMYDPLTMQLHYGKITSISHEVQGTEITTTLRLQVPSEFVL